MKNYSIVFYSIFFLLSLNSLAAGQKTPEKCGENFYIAYFNHVKGPQRNDLYSIALPKSIRTVLRKNFKLTVSEEKKDLAELKKSGYNIRIQGTFSSTEKFIKVDFTVECIRLKKILIFADITGYSDPRVFDLVDNLTDVVRDTLINNFKKVLKEPLFISIDKNGKVTKKDLSEMDLSNRSYRGTSFDGLRLINSKINNSDFSGSSFNKAVINKTSFKGTKLTNSSFKNAMGKNVDFTNANLVGTDFDGANITNPKLDGAVIDTYGDFIFGISSGAGSLAWFNFLGRINRLMYFGLRGGYAYEKSGEGLVTHSLPLLFTITFYFYNYNALQLNTLRPYLQIGAGKVFTLSGENVDAGIALLLGGLDWHLTKVFALNAELGVLHKKGKIGFSLGAGVKFYPDLYNRKVKQDEKVYYIFTGLKIAAGINFSIETARVELAESETYSPGISFTAGFLFAYIRPKRLGFVIDLEFNRFMSSKENAAEESTLSLDYFTVSIIPVVPFAQKYFAGLGVYLGINLGATKSYSSPVEISTDLQNLASPVTAGVIITFGFKFNSGKFKMMAGMDVKLDLSSVFVPALPLSYAEGYALRNLSVSIYYSIGI